MDLDLKNLTKSEHIWLWRRRHPSTTGRVRGRGGSCMSENEAAALLKIKLETYQAAEREDAAACSEVVSAIRSLGDRLNRPTPAEACALARRRAAIYVDDLCQIMGGISKPTFYLREKQAHPEMVRMWEQRGFTF